MDRDSIAAINIFNTVQANLPEMEEDEQLVHRPRSAKDVDLSKFDPECERCDSGISRWVQVPKPPRPAKSEGGRARREWHKIVKGWRDEDNRIPVVCVCVSRNGGVTQADLFQEVSGEDGFDLESASKDINDRLGK